MGYFLAMLIRIQPAVYRARVMLRSHLGCHGCSARAIGRPDGLGDGYEIKGHHTYPRASYCTSARACAH